MMSVQTAVPRITHGGASGTSCERQLLHISDLHVFQTELVSVGWFASFGLVSRIWVGRRLDLALSACHCLFKFSNVLRSSNGDQQYVIDGEALPPGSTPQREAPRKYGGTCLMSHIRWHLKLSFPSSRRFSGPIILPFRHGPTITFIDAFSYNLTCRRSGLW